MNGPRAWGLVHTGAKHFSGTELVRIVDIFWAFDIHDKGSQRCGWIEIPSNAIFGDRWLCHTFKAILADVKRYDVHSIPTMFSITVHLGIVDLLVQRRLLLLLTAVSFSSRFPISRRRPGVFCRSIISACVKEYISFLESVWSHSNGWEDGLKHGAGWHPCSHKQTNIHTRNSP